MATCYLLDKGIVILDVSIPTGKDMMYDGMKYDGMKIITKSRFLQYRNEIVVL